MKSRQLFRSLSFRLACLVGAVVSALIFIACILTIYLAHNLLMEQTRLRIEAETALLMIDYEQDGLTELMHDVRERVSRSHSSRLRYALQDNKSGRIIFDDSSPLPQEAAWVIHRVQVSAQERESVLWKVTPLKNNFTLGVGASLKELEFLKSYSWKIAGFLILLILPLLFLFFLFLSKKLVAHIERLTELTKNFGKQETGARLHVRGTGDEFDRLALAMNSLLERAEELLLGVKRVSSNIAHDLRTPLSRIRIKLVELIDSGKDDHQPRDVSQALHELLEDVDQLLSIFGALLRIAELESAHSFHATQVVNMTSLVSELCEFYSPLAEDVGKRFHVDLSIDLFVRGDKDLLRQMFVQVLENALQYTPPQTTISVTTRCDDSRREVCIADNGLQLSPLERARLVEPFYRCDASRHSPGTGLGLSVSAAIAKAHRIELAVEDNSPGLRFAFRWMNTHQTCGDTDPNISERTRTQE
jgi:signal transduction histidine kinase